jgi:recombination protein RecT
MTTKNATDKMKEIASASANNSNIVKHKGTLNVIRSFAESESVKKRFADALQKNPSAFLSSIISLVSSSTNFDGVDPNTIMMGAMQAATLDLPINPNLGFAYIIPYSGKAQFQIGAKGLVQLALRTGQYQTINTTEVYEGELISRNRLTGEIIIDGDKKASEKVIGYVAFFRLTNGFEKSLYMSVVELEAHGKRYSKSFNNPSGPWKTNPHAMMLKTPLKLLLSKYGILSVQMQQAIQADQAIVKQDEAGEITYEFIDNDGKPVDEEPKEEEIKADKKSKKKESSPADEENDPDYWISEFQKAKTEAELDKWEEKNMKELGRFGGADAERIATARFEHRKSLRAKK